MSDTFHPGELFVYTNGNRWELGMVKRLNNTGDGYFCWYSRGDTAANTPTCHMHKLANAGFTHIEQLLDNAIPTPTQAIAATVGKGKAKAHPWGYERDTGFFDETCCECGELNDISAKYCNQCGREIQIDMSVIEYAEDWYTPQHVCKVNADGTLTSLRDGKTYIDAATVGEGTCHIETTESWLPAERYHRCKSCGAFFAVLNASHDIPPRVCPNCGRRVMGA